MDWKTGPRWKADGATVTTGQKRTLRSLRHPSPRHPALADAAAIELLVLDVDGVLTDGGIVYADDGAGAEGVPRPRRLGAEALAAGGQAGGDHHRPDVAASVEVRAAELGRRPRVPGGRRQAAGLPADCWRDGLAPGAGVLRRRRPAGPAAAAALRPGRRRRRRLPEVRQDAHYVTAGRPAAAGRSARSVELILGCQGRWQRSVIARLNGIEEP